MPKMCRYEYGNGKCAHPKNISLECVGEDSCTLYGEDMSLQDFENVNYFSQDADEDECPNTECGVYCKKYNRFYCAGKENCENEEEYFSHMNTYGGIDIEKNK